MEKLRRGFTDNSGGIFVGPETQEVGVAEMAVAGPLGEADLGDEVGFEPLHFGHLLKRSSRAEG